MVERVKNEEEGRGRKRGTCELATVQGGLCASG